MYAIVEIAGQQHKVQKDQALYVPRIDGETGAALSFDQVLLVEDGDNIQVGAPLLSGITISAKILEHVKGDKVIVFKKKRRKGYRKKNGHRQQFTKIQIEDIQL
ncbi:large subunit ribosomal protein L21 [Catalinimonas alkaloidigena]|uniref:Large ribosomal subunit protein bL21 n=1 Tax=Catalinimonas alkaloidigena TaxID=1075417 RepID=A0A1G9F632_9BACT|nr:50S ribosomal protein L21 [Catalinimonas alkaloidigena]SDK83805.1 large subunit ribosomal protein L21 [Catalinimonas alkaloidigena]